MYPAVPAPYFFKNCRVPHQTHTRTRTRTRIYTCASQDTNQPSTMHEVEIYLLLRWTRKLLCPQCCQRCFKNLCKSLSLTLQNSRPSFLQPVESDVKSSKTILFYIRSQLHFKYWVHWILIQALLANQVITYQYFK